MANDYSAIRTTIAALIPDNQNCEISAKDVRDTLEAMLAATEDVDSRIGTGGSTGGTGGTVDLTPYLTKADASTTYQPIGAYLTTAAADAKYALSSAIPDLTPYQTTAQADAKYALISAIPSLTGYLKADGSVPLAATFTPTDDRDLVYKAWVEQKISTASIGGSGSAPDLSTYLLKAEAATTYATKAELPDLTGYITTAAADAKYALSSAIPDITGLATTAALTSGLAGKQPINGVLSTFAAQMTTATSGSAPVITSSVATLTSLATEFATATNGQVFGKKSDGTAGFLDLPTAPDLTGYLKADGSVPLADAYTPSGDHDIATKAAIGAEMRRILRHGASGGYLANIIAEGLLLTADASLTVHDHGGLYLACQGDITLTLSDSEQWQQWEEIGVFSETGTVTVHPAGATKINGATTDITIKALDFRVLKMHRANEWFCVKTV